MIYAKPSSLLEMRAGKAIGAQSGLAATINWIVSCFANIKTEDDEAIPGLDDGYPRLPSGGLKSITGTDGNTVTNVKSLTFESADDSNVEVTLTDDGGGHVTAKVGVYYL